MSAKRERSWVDDDVRDCQRVKTSSYYVQLPRYFVTIMLLCMEQGYVDSGLGNLENKGKLVKMVKDAAYTDDMVLLRRRGDESPERVFIDHQTAKKWRGYLDFNNSRSSVPCESPDEWARAFEIKNPPLVGSSDTKWRILVGRGHSSMYQTLIFTYRHLNGLDTDTKIEAPASVHRGVLCGPKSIMRHVYDDSLSHVASLFAAKSGKDQHFAKIRLCGSDDAPRWTPASVKGKYKMFIKLHDAV